ncbi:MAG: ABC transporter ATP-binding protein [Candidatus Leucobacter sulfamidivorax]|nr:ABC transporter ATP-binding protein [Candidatus Leucobacter sulfamidivorax]
MTGILQLTGLSGGYNQGDVVHEVNLEIAHGELVSVLGPNGAGKTTLACLVSGQLTPSRGRIVFNGVEVTRIPSDRRARMGVAHVPQGRRVFPDLTVTENLQVAQFAAGRRAAQESRDFVYDLFPKLLTIGNRKGGVLSGGEQQMLAVGRAMLCEPRLILLDEPSLGLAPLIVAQMYEAFVKIRERGVAILLAEQAVASVMKVADRVAVLESGKIVRLGAPATFIDDEFIAASYFGGRGQRPTDTSARDSVHEA